MDKIQKEIDGYKSILISDFDGQYRDELDPEDEQKGSTVVELIQNADLESIDFNIGFEQGYLRGLEVALSLIK